MPVRIPIKDYFSGKQKTTALNLKKRLIREGYFERECCRCQLSQWLDGPIPLELHHINGNKFDNALENLEILCPNCHALTDSYRGKNINRYKKVS